MKLILIAVLTAVVCTARCGTNDISSAQLHTYQQVQTYGTNTTGGFLLYFGKHVSTQVVVLVADFGSASPSEDLRVFVQTKAGYECILSIPMLMGYGFICNAEGDVLKIFLSKDLGRSRSGEKPLATVDLAALILAYDHTH